MVPRRRRVAWRRQWDGEIAHRVRANGAAGSLRFALGAFAHALYLRREEGGMTGLSGDLRHAVRALARRPGFTALSVLTLAVGIGSATVVFSLAEALLLRPLPLEDGDRLVSLFSSNPPNGWDRYNVSWPDYVDWTAQEELFASSAYYGVVESDLSGEGEPVRLSGAEVGRGFFETLGTRAIVGRTFGDDDQDGRGVRTLVFSEAVWRRLFGGDPSVLGRTVHVDGDAYTVVGVVPDDQAWPLTVDFWVPLGFGAHPPEWVDRRSNHSWETVARLRPGVAVADASRRVGEVARRWYDANATGTEVGTTGVVVPLRSTVAPDAAPVMLGIMGLAVFFVLLIACMNQSNLLLTHALGRARELSLRSALGARRGRLVGLLLGESLLLSLAGGAVGVALAGAALGPATRLAPMTLPPSLDVRLDWTVLSGAVAISVLASVLAGLLPALRASRTSVADALKEGSFQASQGRGGSRLRRGMVITQLALSVVLLTAAGLTIRTFREQLTADAGFDTDDLLTFTLRLPTARYPDEALQTQFFEQAVRRLEGLPGVAGATVTSRLPLGAATSSLYRVFLFEGAPEPPAGPDFGATWVAVDPEYFRTTGIRPVRGRAFTEDDGADAPPVIIVNESLARRMSPEQDIIGRRIESWRDERSLREVVGVVPDIQFATMTGRDEPAVFVPAAQAVRPQMSFMVRTTSDPSALVPVVRTALAELDADVALADLGTLSEAHRQGLAGVRFVMVLFGAFGAIALVLAVGGVYGLVAYSVSRRTQEIGIRIAMGASGGSVQAGVVAEGAALAVAGIAVGLVLAVAAARALASAVVGLSWLDPVALGGVAALLGAATLLASWIPARRVLRVDPVEALRRE
jgi:putative ABC transport system permease protein